MHGGAQTLTSHTFSDIQADVYTRQHDQSVAHYATMIRVCSLVFDPDSAWITAKPNRYVLHCDVWPCLCILRLNTQSHQRSLSPAHWPPDELKLLSQSDHTQGPINPNYCLQTTAPKLLLHPRPAPGTQGLALPCRKLTTV